MLQPKSLMPLSVGKLVNYFPDELRSSRLINGPILSSIRQKKKTAAFICRFSQCQILGLLLLDKLISLLLTACLVAKPAMLQQFPIFATVGGSGDDRVHRRGRRGLS